MGIWHSVYVRAPLAQSNVVFDVFSKRDMPLSTEAPLNLKQGNRKFVDNKLRVGCWHAG